MTLAVVPRIPAEEPDGPLAGLWKLEPADLPRWKQALVEARSLGFGAYFPYVLTHQREARSTVLITEDAGSLCSFLLREDRDGPHVDLYLPPMPMDVDVTRRCLERANDFNGDRSARILRIEANDAVLAANIPELSVREHRKQYLYTPSAYADLSGGKYERLRRQLAKVSHLPDLESVPYSDRYAESCRALLEQWSKRHRKAFGKSGGAGVARRVLALTDMLSAPDLIGEVALLEGRVVGYWLGGEIRPGVGCFVDGKSDFDVPGIGYWQRYRLLTRHDEFELVNDGTDARTAGLRQVKDSFRPFAMHTEYRATQVEVRPEPPRVTPRRRGDTTHLGVLCNLDTNADPREQLSPSVINRVYLIEELLSPDGIPLFLYNPKDVTSGGDAQGFVLENRVPIPVTQAVPQVNANWSYATRRLLRLGMGYQTFKHWTRERGLEVYVPYEFSELVSNKLKTWDAVRTLDASLHPHTEAFDGSPAQIESFLERSSLVFIKPRAGHKGNRIFVLRRTGAAHSLDYYDSAGRRSFAGIPLASVVSMIEAATGREHFVVQEGIESLRHEESVFDVRVVMVHDGEVWHSVFETRRAPRSSELTNVYQGGTIHVTGELLASVVGPRTRDVVMERLNGISHQVAAHLESRFPDSLPEIGLDFVIDRDLMPHLVEVNAKPGIAGIGSERRLFEWAPEERPLHEMWTFPHMKHLAGFLRRRVVEARSMSESRSP